MVLLSPRQKMGHISFVIFQHDCLSGEILTRQSKKFTSCAQSEEWSE